jgi:transcription elongation GreA/GreB family factor
LPSVRDDVGGEPIDEHLALSSVLVETEDDLDVQVGDVVKYVDTAKPDDVLSVQIVHKASDLANGVVSAATPLAQTLLGSVVGDEVNLHLPGTGQRVFRIIDIKRPA